MEIQKVAVIGSGVMGAGIAAHCANAGLDVYLFDIVPSNADDRSILARNAIQQMIKSDPEMLMHRSFSKRISPGNLEDDLEQLADADWIVEVVLERLDIKHEIYSKVAKYRKRGSIVSSNTSTLPRNQLIEGMDSEMSEHFLITHFFNPPRYLPLLEVVSGTEVSEDTISLFCDFADIKLGKQVIQCNDTPGFIGNRLGVFHAQRSINATIDRGLTIEEADSMLGRPIGHPKTAVFGLLDLVGLDLIPHILGSLDNNLGENDPFKKHIRNQELLQGMIEDGWVGRKGKGGFYRLNKEGGKRVKEARNLKTGEYAPANRKAGFASAKLGKQGISKLIDAGDEGSELVKEVLIDTLSYACYLVPEVTENVADIDTAMKIGYNWKKGPFEMIDDIGSEWLAKQLELQGQEIPEYLETVRGQKIHTIENGTWYVLCADGQKHEVNRPLEYLSVADLKRKGEPLERNASASVWDMGDDILLVEYHSKMNAMDPLSMEMLFKAVELSENDKWKGIVVGNDAQNFCAGANLGIALFALNLGAVKEMGDFVKNGQDAYMALKYCSVPVVTASTGLSLGGGCEVHLHADAVQAHSESYVGLVEVGVGIIPAWGGCKELLARNRLASDVGGPMPAVMKTFETIGTAKIAKSAHQAKEIGYFRETDKITMNRIRLLADAKNTCIELAQDYVPPEPHTYFLPGPSGKAALDMAVADMRTSGVATPHDVVVANELAQILSGGAVDHLVELGEEDILLLEREAIGSLAKEIDTLDRMEHMLTTGKPLRN